MKRSEMLQAIKDVLYPHLPQYPECPDFIAESVLQVIEGGNPSGKAMLPPFNYELYYRTWRDGGNGYEWEKE